jgi:hypothetical protein
VTCPLTTTRYGIHFEEENYAFWGSEMLFKPDIWESAGKPFVPLSEKIGFSDKTDCSCPQQHSSLIQTYRFYSYANCAFPFEARAFFLARILPSGVRHVFLASQERVLGYEHRFWSHD